MYHYRHKIAQLM